MFISKGSTSNNGGFPFLLKGDGLSWPFLDYFDLLKMKSFV